LIKIPLSVITKLPGSNIEYNEVLDADGKLLLTLIPTIDNEIREEVVKRLEVFDEMLEALKKANELIERFSTEFYSEEDVMIQDMVKKAIAKAESK
jgi:hypothetical protein